MLDFKLASVVMLLAATSDSPRNRSKGEKNPPDNLKKELQCSYCNPFCVILVVIVTDGTCLSSTS